MRMRHPYCLPIRFNLHDDEPAPVFLIGFPRSGTTLLDTVLMGHSQITVVEEQNMVPQMEHAVLDKASIWEAEQLSDQDIARARGVYYDTLAQHVQDQVVIDKMPLNITKVPLIHRVFPNARYILALRHPMDSILSCWMQNFALNAAMGNMLQLPRIAEFYDYSMRIFDVATARYDLNVHRVRYEDLVLDLEGLHAAQSIFWGSRGRMNCWIINQRPRRAGAFIRPVTPKLSNPFINRQVIGGVPTNII